MTAFLVFLACFQFLCNATNLSLTPVYFVLNPYVTLLPMLLFWLAGLGFYRQTADRSLALIWLLLLGIQLVALGAYSRMDGFPFNYIRSMQFFWGPTLLVPMLLGLFRLTNQPRDALKTAQQFIKLLAYIAAAVSLFEVVFARVLHLPPTLLPWVRDTYLGIHRPFGLPSYPQPNAVILGLLFWLSYLYKVPGHLHRIILFIALALTLSATGQILFLALTPLLTRRPFTWSSLAVLSLGSMVLFATLTHQQTVDPNGPFEKFDLAYANRLSGIFSHVTQVYLSGMTTDNLLFGTPVLKPTAAVGVTHDWAYFDVFYVYGLFGVGGYLLLYGCLAYLVCPPERGRSAALFFAILVLIANFHYGTLNYYIGQFLFSILAALRIQRIYVARATSGSAQRYLTPMGQPALGAGGGDNVLTKPASTPA